MTLKTPEQIAEQIMGDSETTTMWSDQEGGWVTIASQIVAAIKADRAQRDTYTFDEETAVEAVAWKKGEQFWGEEAGTYVAGYVDGWRGNRTRKEAACPAPKEAG